MCGLTLPAAMGEAARLGADEFTEVLDRALSDLESDERSGPLARVSGLNVRLELTDLGIAVRITSSEDADRHLQWSFDDEGPSPRVDLAMNGSTADAYLRGEESLAVAIVRGRARLRAEAGAAVVCLPVMRLLIEPYRRWAERLDPAGVAS